jgi:hypothetical protein
VLAVYGSVAPLHIAHDLERLCGPSLLSLPSERHRRTPTGVSCRGSPVRAHVGGTECRPAA